MTEQQLDQGKELAESANSNRPRRLGKIAAWIIPLTILGPLGYVIILVIVLVIYLLLSWSFWD